MKEDTTKPTLLIIDDAPESIDVLRGVLEGDYQVKASINGSVGLELAAEAQPDLILLDVMLPDMDGYEVCTRLKLNAATRAIPVIFITTLSEVANEARGLDVGAVDYVTKPYVAELVRSRVRTHVSLHNQSRELERQVKQRTAELTETRLEIIRRLGRAAEYRDNETGMHVIRMSYYSQLIALAAGASAEQSSLILSVAPMHDIGKIGIPDRILLKPGKLDAAEWEIMKTHTTAGAEIIGEHPSEILRTAHAVALGHHEKWDGTGYPNALKREEIPFVARVVALADVFDALRSPRPYKAAWELDRTLDYIREQRGKHFDPVLVEAFFKALPECLKIHDANREPSM